MDYPQISTVNNTMMQLENGVIELVKKLSDHSMIKVEFKHFVIYSWNILNGDDKPAIYNTMKAFVHDISLLEEPMIIPGAPKELENKLTEFYFGNNEKRMRSIAQKIKQLRDKNIKPVIFIFQEVSQNCANILVEALCDSNYNAYLSDFDQVVYYKNGEHIINKKYEMRLTIIPTIFETINVQNIKSYNSSKIDRTQKGYKSQLLTQFRYQSKIYTLVNIHFNYMSTKEEICDFLQSVVEFENLIVIGDFNNNIEKRLSNSIRERFPTLNLKYKATSNDTFIVDMPADADISERSKILDQVLYKLDVGEL